MKIDVEAIKKLREATGAGVADCRMALEQSKGDAKKATEILRKKGIEKADKKSDRQVKAGMVFTYAHHTGRVGVILALACETDFVAKTDDFQNLGRELALHVCASTPSNVEELLKQEYVRDPSKTIENLIKEVIGKLGENIQVLEFKVVKV
ncbi:translation elongation factor Ts [Candidatus Amesbacteria bacterium RIFOXYB1_FULL_44_23]|uniref:Elongation factor Ts n=1 Tax=Candidatus Amesbacteria bacterium RIFOXYB1_FULL_44_23 TaxID=1797263 RepID=A0A1F4ZVS6_9BACT|nr:MAG: translation elongation factor Ts [Candidatus Amesbacteria bacterium RIFOXYB1_FULL_44_23]